MVNDRIREIRKSKGITQCELFQKLMEQGLELDGYTNLISKIESHKRRVLADEVKFFAEALGVQVSELLEEEVNATGTDGR